MKVSELTGSNKTLIVVVIVGFALGVAVSVLLQSFDLKGAIPLFLLPLLLVMPFLVPKLRSFARDLRWWHALWLLFFVSGLTFRVRGVEQIYENPLDSAALFRVGLVTLIAFILLLKVVVTKGGVLLHNLFRGLVMPMTLYALFGMISAAWSVYPSWTFYKSAEYFVDIFLLAAIITCFRSLDDFKRFFDWTWLLLGGLMGTVWLGVLLWPDEAIRRGVGITGIQIHGVLPAVSENGTGDLGGLLGAMALGRLLFMKQNRKLYLIVLLMAIATLILAYSRTPMTGFLLAILVMLYAGRRLTLLTAFLVSMGIILVTPFREVFWEFFRRGQSVELFMSLSGRVYSWEYLWEIFKDHPIFGLGAYSGGRFVVLTALGADLSSSVHNSFLEVVIGSGLTGLVFILAALGGTWWYLWKGVRATKSGTLEHCLTVEALGVLTIETFRAFFSSGPLIWHPAVRFLLVLSYAEFLRRRLKNCEKYCLTREPNVSSFRKFTN